MPDWGIWRYRPHIHLDSIPSALSWQTHKPKSGIIHVLAKGWTCKFVSAVQATNIHDGYSWWVIITQDGDCVPKLEITLIDMAINDIIVDCTWHYEQTTSYGTVNEEYLMAMQRTKVTSAGMTFSSSIRLPRCLVERLGKLLLLPFFALLRSGVSPLCSILLFHLRIVHCIQAWGIKF